ncbi:Septin-type guanine nucleotide-binding (G) domain-containing protein, partial [Cladochytrium replicatum]
DEIIRYLESQFEATLLEESKVKRNPKSPDYQTHACLYLLDPQICYANRGLTPVDRLTLKRLCTRVNVFPCLSKADLLTTRQIKDLRKWIMDDISQNDIPIYKFVEDPDVDYDDETKALNAELRSLLPFAIINSEESPDGAVLSSPTADNGEAVAEPAESTKPKFLGREYTWGVVEVTNPLHCDFIALKQTLFGTHIDELRIVTREALYEQWRTEKLL